MVSHLLKLLQLTLINLFFGQAWGCKASGKMVCTHFIALKKTEQRNYNMLQRMCFPSDLYNPGPL